MHDYCDGSRGPVTCGSERETRDKVTALEQEKKALDALKQKKSDLNDAKSRASNSADKDKIAKDIDQVERDISDAERRVDKAASELDARKRLVDSAISTITTCIDKRNAVMAVFASATDKVRGESDAAIVPFARQLRDRYEGSKSGHVTAIKDKENALNTCKNSRP